MQKGSARKIIGIKPKNATWISEALLPSSFLPRFRSDLLAESRTHADGIIGHIAIGKHGKADVELLANDAHFERGLVYNQASQKQKQL